MALVTFNNLTGLDFSFNGEPFCNVSTGVGSLDGLDAAYEGEPFAGTEVGGGGGEDIAVQAPAGVVTGGGGFFGISIVLTMAPGVIAASGICGEINTFFSGETTEIMPEAGTVAATGRVEGIKLLIALPVGRIDVDGRCGNVAKATVIVAAMDEIIASGVAPGISYKISPPPARIASSADISGLLCVLAATPAIGLVTGGIAGFKCLSVTTGVKRRYECRILCDGFDDITVPISAFSSRQRYGYPSYSEITIQGLQHLANVAARMDGYFVVSAIISKDGEDLLREDIFTAPIDKMTITGNPSLQNTVLSGARPAAENPAPQIAPLRGIVYRSLSYGKLLLRSAVTDLYLKPGDSVTYDGDSFTARTITHSFTPTGAFMEVRETDA